MSNISKGLTEAYGRYDRRDAYQRDYDSSVAGMGKRDSYAYQQDGGANDEGWDEPERSYQPKPAAKKGFYFYNVPVDQYAKAQEVGLFKTKSGKWYSPFQNTRADMFFGKGRYWEPKNESTQLDELSPQTLANYKKKAGADATASDKRGDYKRGDKRMSGIMKATRKEFDNDSKGVAEGYQDDSKEREENLRYSRSRNPVADAIRKKLNPNQKEQNKEKDVAEGGISDKIKGAAKSVKRAAQGWGINGELDMPTASGVVASAKKLRGDHDDPTVPSLPGAVLGFRKHPPKNKAQEFAKKVYDREMKQRGYGRFADKDEQGVAEGADNLSYIGNCTDDDVIEHIFGDATNFAQAVEEYGDEFTIDELVVKYDPESDVHSFYYKNQGVAEEQVDENLHKWFKEKWVRFGPDGKIRGDCARGDDSEGKPKCLPQSKAHSLGKKGRASAASRKRREDPNPERSGKAINVNTKKKSNEGLAEGAGTMWEVSYDYGPHMTKTVKVKASSEEEAEAKVEKAAEKKGLNIMINSVTPVEQGVAEQELDEACWKGYHKEGNKKMFGKTYPNCVKNTNEEQELDEYGDTSKGQKMLAKVHHRAADRVTSKQADKDSKYASKAQQTQDRAWERLAVKEEHHAETCPHCGGEMVSEELMNEKKDACYYKVKSRYKVWPSAYASGALVKCRKKGASNWGNGGKSNESVAEDLNDTVYPNAEVIKSRNGKPVGEIYQDGNSWGCFHYKADTGYDMFDSREDAIQELKNLHNENMGKGSDYTIKGYAEDQLDEKWTKKYKDSINCSNPKGFSQKAHCAGKQKNESAIMKGLK
jgi:hypothetical protein